MISYLQNPLICAAPRPSCVVLCTATAGYGGRTWGRERGAASDLAVADCGNVLDDDDVVGPVGGRVRVEDLVGGDHIGADAALADLLAAEAARVGQVEAVVVAEMVVRDHREWLAGKGRRKKGRTGEENGLKSTIKPSAPQMARH